MWIAPPNKFPSWEGLGGGLKKVLGTESLMEKKNADCQYSTRSRTTH